MNTRCVTSRPTIVTGQPAPNTRSAASGSLWMFASAAGVALPGPSVLPPISTTSRTCDAICGSRRSAERDVRQRADRHEGDLARARHHLVDDELRCRHVERVAIGRRQIDVALPSSPWTNATGAAVRHAERIGGAGRDRDVGPAGDVEQAQRVDVASSVVTLPKMVVKPTTSRSG